MTNSVSRRLGYWSGVYRGHSLRSILACPGSNWSKSWILLPIRYRENSSGFRQTQTSGNLAASFMGRWHEMLLKAGFKKTCMGRLLYLFICGHLVVSASSACHHMQLAPGRYPRRILIHPRVVFFFRVNPQATRGQLGNPWTLFFVSLVPFVAIVLSGGAARCFSMSSGGINFYSLRSVRFFIFFAAFAWSRCSNLWSSVPICGRWFLCLLWQKIFRGRAARCSLRLGGDICCFHPCPSVAEISCPDQPA